MPGSPSHDRIVEALVADAGPVRRLRPGRLFAIWAAVLVAVLLAFLPRMRPDLAQVWTRPLFLVDVLILIGAAMAAAWLALRIAVPARAPGRALDAAAVLLGATGLVLFALGTPVGMPSFAAFAAKGIVCGVLTVVMASPLAAVLFVALRRGAPLQPLRAGTLAGAGALFAAAAGMRLGCAADDPAHLLTWHAGPVVAGLAVSTLLGGVWLRRWWLAGPRISGGAAAK